MWKRDRVVQVELHDNIHEGVNAQGEDCWFADIYYLEVGATGNLAQRIEKNYSAYLALAKAEEARAQERERLEKTTLSIDDLTEMAADQEFRLCLLELGV